MHIILSFLGFIVTVVILLKRLADAGVSLGGLNPFLWHQQKHWQDKTDKNPIFAIEDPMEASALILTGATKISGDMTSEQKSFLLSVFEQDFHLSGKESAELLASSTSLLGDGQSIKTDLEKVLKPSLENFSQTQLASTVNILNRLSQLDVANNELLQEFVIEAKQLLEDNFN
jgi:hypothetical protein